LEKIKSHKEVSRKPQPDLHYIISLPKEKEVLDYIKQQLSLTSSLEKFEMIEELFELHRTSSGFNPRMLSKVRFRRIKSEDIKKFLSDLNQSLSVIVNTEEYKKRLLQYHNSGILFEQLQAIKNKLQVNDYHNIEELVERFKKQLNDTDDYEIVLALYRFMQPYFPKKAPNPEIKME
jgi:hypothetical protein